MYLDHEWQCSDLDDELGGHQSFDMHHLVVDDSVFDTCILSSAAKLADDERYVTLKELRDCFHLSKKEAAKQLGISEKHLNKVKREFSIEKWPHRKVLYVVYSSMITTFVLDQAHSQ